MYPISFRTTLLGSSVALALGAPNAQAALVTNVFGTNTWSTDSANITLLWTNGGVQPEGCSTNNVHMTWDGNAYNSGSDYTGPGGSSNVIASSTTPFFGHVWTAHDIQVFTPGSYSFDVTLQTLTHPNGANTETGALNVTVGAGQLGMHMLWDWNGNNNIDMFVVLAQNSIFGSGLLYSTQLNTPYQSKCDANFTGTIIKNCLYDGPQYGSAGAPTKNELWMLASTDGNGDGVMGIPMAPNGPFAGFSANYNANLTPTPKPAAVPIPAAVWLFGSGLLGLIGITRHRKKTEVY